MAVRGASCAAGAAHPLPSPTAFSEPAPGPLFGSAERAPQHRHASRFYEYYACPLERDWLLSALAGLLKGVPPCHWWLVAEVGDGRVSGGGGVLQRPRCSAEESFGRVCR